MLSYLAGKHIYQYAVEFGDGERLVIVQFVEVTMGTDIPEIWPLKWKSQESKTVGWKSWGERKKRDGVRLVRVN